MKKKIRIVHNWRNCYKWVSLHCMTFAGSISGTWLLIPDDLRQSIPQKWLAGITIALMILGVVGRFVNQTKDDK